MSNQTDHIRRLNDMARTQPQIVNATWVMTNGVQRLLAGKDTQNVPGSPPIADTIFGKIDGAAAFLSDLTFVATRLSGCYLGKCKVPLGRADL